MTVIIPNIWRIVEFPTKITTYPPSINYINICCKSKGGRDGFQTLVSSMFHFVKLGVVAFASYLPKCLMVKDNMFDGLGPYIYIILYIILFIYIYWSFIPWINHPKCVVPYHCTIQVRMHANPWRTPSECMPQERICSAQHGRKWKPSRNYCRVDIPSGYLS